VSAQYVVRVLPADAELLVDEEDDIFWAARRAGWKWPTVCEGSCECGQCFVKVLEGEENLSPMSDAERKTIDEGMMAGKPHIRLACQTFVSGPAVVKRLGARPQDSLTSGGKSS
jgi:ferredoxin